MTDKQMTQMVLDYIIRVKRENGGLSPSYRDMSSELNLSVRKIQSAIHALLGLEILSWGPRGAIRVRGERWELDESPVLD